MRFLYVILNLLLFSGIGFSQETTIQVIDSQTTNPVSFAKVYDGVNPPIITDIDGKATVNVQKELTYSFRFFDYKDTSVLGSDVFKNPIVLLSPLAQVYGEIVVRPGENPAHRIIQNTMDKKKENDPLKNDAFSYHSYSKLYVTGELKENVDRDTITDSTSLKFLNLIDRQYLFLTETEAQRTFIPPAYDKEEIISYNVSGIKEPLIATLLNQFQSFSFYDNNFELGQSEYINPIAPGGLKRYLFILQDTIFHTPSLDTTYVIQFRPHKGKNFDGLEGYLYINTNNWAIEKVIASPYSIKEEQTGRVKISQEYEITGNKKWFPKKISTEIDMAAFQIGNYAKMVARGSLYVRDVEFPDNVKRKSFNPVSVTVSRTALKDSVRLKEVREGTATGKEDRTYVVVDSIADKANFQRLYNIATILSTGKIPISVISLPIDRLISYNDQEGFRFGLGIETNNRLSEVVQFGGYFAYGLRDKKWKYGGEAMFTFNQDRLLRLKLQYSNDLFERGGTDLFEDEFNLMSQSAYKNYFVNRLDGERRAGINLSGLIRQNMRLQLFGNYKRYSFTDDYHYLPLIDGEGKLLTDFDIAEVGFIFNWNIREKVMLLNNRRFSLGTKWPKITLKAVKGLKGVFQAQRDYYRLNLSVEQDFKIRSFGSINLFSRSGMTIGEVPLILQQVQEGTGRNWTVSVLHTFETMRPGEFFSDKYTSLFVRLTFLPLKNKTKWTEPLIGIHSAVGFGAMTDRMNHINYNFESPTKGYLESGLLIDNILKSSFVGIGAGVFYRYGAYKLPVFKDNILYKLSLRISLFNTN